MLHMYLLQGYIYVLITRKSNYLRFMPGMFLLFVGSVYLVFCVVFLFCLSSFCVVCRTLPMFLDYPFLIALSVFSSLIFFISYYPYPVITKCSEAMKTFKGAPHRFYPFISRCKEAIKAQMDVSYYLYLVRNTSANYMKSHDFILFTFIHL